MPSSGIVAIDPANNDAAVIDASTLSIAPEECPQEGQDPVEDANQEDDEQLSPMPCKKAPLVTPRTDRKVSTSPTEGGSGNTTASSHTPKASKSKTKKKVAVATPVAVEDSVTPKKSKKSTKAKNVPMKTMKHFFGSAGVVKAKKTAASSSSTKISNNLDEEQPKKADTSFESSADSLGKDVSKVKSDKTNATKKAKAKVTPKPKTKQPKKKVSTKKKAAPKSTSTDTINLEDMDDSPMDALAIVSRSMSAGRRGRVTSQKKTCEENSVENKSSSDKDKDTSTVVENAPKADKVVIEIDEATSTLAVDNGNESAEVVPAKEPMNICDSDDDDDATVAYEGADTSATESDNKATVEKDDSMFALPEDDIDFAGEGSDNAVQVEKVSEAKVECNEVTMSDMTSSKGTSGNEKSDEPVNTQPDVIIIDEPSPEAKPEQNAAPPAKAVEAAPPKKARDPNAPKKPKSAWNLYQIAKRNEFKAANPNTKAGEITKLMSAHFKSLNAKDKAEWEEKAKDDKLRYKNEMATYKPPEEVSDSDSSEKKVDANKPAKKDGKSTILKAFAACTPKSKGDKSTKVKSGPSKKAASVPASKPKPVLTEEDQSRLQKFATLKEKYNARAGQLKSRPASDEFTEENLSIENADLPSIDKGAVKVDDSFPDQLLPYLMVIAQGSDLPLSTLANKAVEELSPFVNEAQPLTLELVSSKIKLLAQRKSYLNAPSNLDCFEDNEVGHMWRWELSSIDLLPSKDATKIKKARSTRKKLQSQHKAVMNLISAIDKAVSSIETKSATSQKLISKVSDMEEKVLKFEREEETARLLSKAKAKKQAEENAKKEEEKEEKERKKAEAAKEREAAKLRKAEEKEREKLAKQQELEEKENKRKARMMSFFSKGNTKKKQKLSTSPQKVVATGCNENNAFDSDSFRRSIDTESKHVSTHFKKGTRKRKTQNVRVSVFVTTMSDNPFSQQPYDEEKIITVPNKYKFLGFHEDVRPPYHGTWSKTSSIVTGRKPFGKDTSILDYEVDSEAEWEEGDDDQGEDLNEDAGEEEEDEAPQDEDNDGWLAAEDDLGIDDEDEETRELRKKKLHMEANLQKSGHYKASVVAPQMGGIPHQTECDSDLVEGFAVTNALDALHSHVGCILSPDINVISLDAFPPTDSGKNSDQTKTSSSQSDEMTNEAKKIVAQFVHNCTVKSKEKLVTELLKTHPSISKNRALTMREVDYMAEKKKVPKEAGGGVIWEVKQDILKSLGLEEKDLKQPPKVIVPSPDASSAKPGTNPSDTAAGGSGKKKKDPNAPKKPKSSFMFFSKAKRAEVKAANPDASFGELGKILGNQWKQLSECEKIEYEEKAVADKKRYHDEMEIYSPNGSAADNLAKNATSEVKKTQDPKEQNSKSTPSPSVGVNSTKKRKAPPPPVSAASANLFAAFLKRKKT